MRDRPAVEQHLARRELPVARQGAQQRALAGAVGADDGEELARRSASSEMSRIRTLSRALTSTPWPAAALTVPRAARPASSQRKNGPPTSAVRTPIGSSAGETMVRASASASTRKAPPNSAAAGSRVRWAGPSSRRTMCGAIRPTKPTMPEIATPAPTASATCATRRRFSRSTSTPTWPASRSPSASASSRCAAGSSVGMLMASTSRAGSDRRPGHGAEAAHRPEDQRAQLLLVGDEHQHADAGRGEGIDGDAGQQERAHQGDAFARRDPVDDDGRRRGRRGRPRGAGSHGRRPGGTMWNTFSPSTITDTAASAAPLETPSRPGSANGLRNRLCIAAPPAASAAPTAKAAITRGARMA